MVGDQFLQIQWTIVWWHFKSAFTLEMEGELTSILNFVFVGNVCTMLLLALVYIFIAKEGTSDTQWIV